VLTLEELYQEACNKVSDIFRHCPVIYELSRKCTHITELGLNSKGIRVSILSAQPATYVAYGETEKNVSQASSDLSQVVGNTSLRLRQGHSLKIQIEPTELLIIDTYHSSIRLKQELLKHAGNVKRYIIFPSTYTYAMRGEDGSHPGLPDAIMEFIESNPEWAIIHNVTYNNGLIVIEREPATGPDFDRLYSMVTFDIPDIKWVERYKMGFAHPSTDLTSEEIEFMAEKQVDALNRALRYGIIVGIERNFTDIKIQDKSVLSGYLVYHVGFRNRPLGH